MKHSRIKCGVLSCILVFTLVTSALAAAFPDVTSSSYGWAMDAVERMASDKIILGYEDGTFRPANTVTKLEALVLIARVLGVDDSVNDSFMETAIEKYESKVETYKLPYGEEEMCYLLARNVILESELADYIGTANATKGLKRYEVAVLLTKAMGAEESVKSNVVSVLDYTDEADIPSYAKKYVEYVTEQKLMQGMENNTFSPNTDVNRAQMAVVLDKLIDLAGYEQYNAIVSSIDNLIGTIKLKDADGKTYGYTIKDNVQLRFEGEPFELEDITVGLEAVITLSDGMLFSIDFMTPDVEEEVTGYITSIIRSAASGTQLKINKITLTGTESAQYPVSDTVAITYEDESATMSDLSNGDYVTLTIAKGKITVIKAEPKRKTVKGTVKELVADNGNLNLTITNTDDEEETYIVASEVSVTKNSDKAELNTLRAGDSVSLTLEYERVVQITATSRTKNGTGFIEDIYISSDTSEVTLKMDGSSVTYPLSNNAEVTVDGKKGTIYDLRLSASATVTIESDEIVKISVSPLQDVEQFTGTVDLINASYGLLQVTYYDSTTEQNITRSVFTNSGTKIVNNATGKDVTLKTLTSGITVTVIGSVKTGVFEATTVIVLS